MDGFVVIIREGTSATCDPFSPTMVHGHRPNGAMRLFRRNALSASPDAIQDSRPFYRALGRRRAQKSPSQILRDAVI